MAILLIKIDGSRRTLLARATNRFLPLHSVVRYQAPETVVLTLLGGGRGTLCAPRAGRARPASPARPVQEEWSAAGRDRHAPWAQQGHVDGDASSLPDAPPTTAGVADEIDVRSPPPPPFAVFFSQADCPSIWRCCTGQSISSARSGCCYGGCSTATWRAGDLTCGSGTCKGC